MAAKAELAREAKVDEYGELQRQIDAFRPVLDRHKRLAEEIRGWYGNLAPEDGATLRGGLYTIQIGEKKWERRIISMAALQKRLGLKEFLAACTFPLTQLEKIFGVVEIEQYVKKARTGSRTLDVVANAAPAKGVAA